MTGGMSIESPFRGWPSFLQWLAGAQPATSARAARGHVGAALALPAAGLVAAGRWQRKGRRQPGELKLQTMGRLPRIVIKLRDSQSLIGPYHPFMHVGLPVGEQKCHVSS